MKKGFEMSMFGEIKLFFRLQVYEMMKGILITQSKYIEEMLRMFGMNESRLVGMPMVTTYNFSNNFDFS